MMEIALSWLEQADGLLVIIYQPKQMAKFPNRLVVWTMK
jgi:hypothetical protein